MGVVRGPITLFHTHFPVNGRCFNNIMSHADILSSMRGFRSAMTTLCHHLNRFRHRFDYCGWPNDLQASFQSAVSRRSQNRQGSDPTTRDQMTANLQAN